MFCSWLDSILAILRIGWRLALLRWVLWLYCSFGPYGWVNLEFRELVFGYSGKIAGTEISVSDDCRLYGVWSHFHGFNNQILIHAIVEIVFEWMTLSISFIRINVIRFITFIWRKHCEGRFKGQSFSRLCTVLFIPSNSRRFSATFSRFVLIMNPLQVDL